MEKASNGCKIVQEKSSSEIMEFTVVYQEKNLLTARFDSLYDGVDYNVRIGQIGEATIITVISRPLYCAKMLIYYKGVCTKYPIEIIRYSEGACLNFYYGPAIFYTPGQIRVSFSTNPKDTPEYVYSVKF